MLEREEDSGVTEVGSWCSQDETSPSQDAAWQRNCEYHSIVVYTFWWFHLFVAVAWDSAKLRSYCLSM